MSVKLGNGSRLSQSRCLSLAFDLFCTRDPFIRKINSACVMLAQSCFSPSIPNTLIADRPMRTVVFHTSSARPYHHTRLGSASSHVIPSIDASGCSCDQHMATFGMHNATFRRASCNGQYHRITEETHPCDFLTNCIVDCSGNG